MGNWEQTHMAWMILMWLVGLQYAQINRQCFLSFTQKTAVTSQASFLKSLIFFWLSVWKRNLLHSIFTTRKICAAVYGNYRTDLLQRRYGPLWLGAGLELRPNKTVNGVKKDRLGSNTIPLDNSRAWEHCGKRSKAVRLKDAYTTMKQTDLGKCFVLALPRLETKRVWGHVSFKMLCLKPFLLQTGEDAVLKHKNIKSANLGT